MLALGDGGGRTTPDPCALPAETDLAGVPVVVLPESLGEDSAVALPPSDCSLGIWTLSRGRFGSLCTLLVLGGGAKFGMDGVEDEETDCTLCGRRLCRVG